MRRSARIAAKVEAKLEQEQKRRKVRQSCTRSEATQAEPEARRSEAKLGQRDEQQEQMEEKAALAQPRSPDVAECILQKLEQKMKCPPQSDVGTKTEEIMLRLQEGMREQAEVSTKRRRVTSKSSPNQLPQSAVIAYSSKHCGVVDGCNSTSQSPQSTITAGSLKHCGIVDARTEDIPARTRLHVPSESLVAGENANQQSHSDEPSLYTEEQLQQCHPAAARNTEMSGTSNLQPHSGNVVVASATKCQSLVTGDNERRFSRQDHSNVGEPRPDDIAFVPGQQVQFYHANNNCLDKVREEPTHQPAVHEYVSSAASKQRFVRPRQLTESAREASFERPKTSVVKHRNQACQLHELEVNSDFEDDLCGANQHGEREEALDTRAQSHVMLHPNPHPQIHTKRQRNLHPRLDPQPVSQLQSAPQSQSQRQLQQVHVTQSENQSCLHNRARSQAWSQQEQKSPCRQHQTPVVATALVSQPATCVRLTIGSKALDEVLGGGIASGQITELSGEHRSGKTQVCFMLCVTVQLPIQRGGANRKALFVDTTGAFRPERLKSMAEHQSFPGGSSAALAGITYVRAHNSEHQEQLLPTISAIFSNGGYGLLVVDSATGLFRTDYPGRANLAARQQALGRYLRGLKTLADEHGCAVVITNEVVDSPELGHQVAVGGNTLASACTTRLSLRKARGETRICKVSASPCCPEVEIVFQIGSGGIEDPSL